MKVSLNWVKKYVDLPKEITNKQIAYDLTLRTVEVESVENTSDKFHDIEVGKILEIKEHLKRLKNMSDYEFRIHNPQQTTDLISVYEYDVIIDNLYKI